MPLQCLVQKNSAYQKDFALASIKASSILLSRLFVGELLKICLLALVTAHGRASAHSCKAQRPSCVNRASRATAI